MKPTLQLKLSQHLTLTPQLQQSIRLLQLSTIELNAEVERMLQENPLLEKADADSDDEAGLPFEGGGAEAPSAATAATSESPQRDDDAAPAAPSEQDFGEFGDYASGGGDGD